MYFALQQIKTLGMALKEEIFDCSGGTPHKHCMDTLIAQKIL